MNNEKEFLTIDEQIFRIKKNGIAIKSESKVKKILLENSYYNIFNGYRDPFLHLKQKNKYINGISFDEIYRLYSFDKQIRSIFFPLLLEIENVIKTRIVYVFLNSRDKKGSLIYSKDDYLKISSYDNSNKNKLKEIAGLVSELHSVIARGYNQSNSLTHYLKNYSYAPLWVLASSISFGTLIKMYNCMSPSNKQEISKDYCMQDSDFLTILRILVSIRNCCAHGNRVYCFDSNIDLPTPDAKKYPIQNKFINSNKGKHNIFNVIIAMMYFIDKKHYTSFINTLITAVKELKAGLKVIDVSIICDVMGFCEQDLEKMKI